MPETNLIVTAIAEQDLPGVFAEMTPEEKDDFTDYIYGGYFIAAKDVLITAAKRKKINMDYERH